MNFDSLITLFLLSLLYLSAVKSAHIHKEGGRSAHDGVISFMEVYNKSLCQPRELLVEILQEYPEEVEHIFIPSCVVLTRCAGCCNDEMLQCTPTSTHNVTMEIKRIKPHKQQNDIFMSFTEHNACECRPKNEVKEQKEKIMIQHTSRLCKGYLTKKESDGVLHQMTWPPQSPNLNPIEMVWDKLDRRVKEKQPTSAQHMWELLQDCWKSIPGEAG
ncbi:vascular endothelial growth factor A-A-like isoform 2-T2 [Salvelinus alpinus]